MWPRVVVVLDTGIKRDHEYFGTSAHYLRSKAADDDIPRALDSGHGTAVAGVVRRWNGAATIKGARLDPGPVGDIAEELALAKLIGSIKDPNAHELVLNMSFGGKTVGKTPLLRASIKQFRSQGRHAVVAAAGDVVQIVDRGDMFPAAWPRSTRSPRATSSPARSTSIAGATMAPGETHTPMATRC